MSIQTYNKPVLFDDRVVTYDSTTGTVGNLEPLTKTGMAMEFQANIKVLSGRDKYLIRNTQFTIVGCKDDNSAITDADIPAGLYGLIEAGTRYASNIAKMSKGVLVGFFAKLGKYRQDEMPISVATGDNSWATMILNNSVTSGLRENECTRNSELPAQPATTSIRIPWFRDDVSRQDLMSDLDNWEYVDSGSGMTFEVGQVKFKDDNRVDMVALPTASVHSIKAGERSKSLGTLLINNDSALGIKSDKVLSEAYSSFDDLGVDDIPNNN